MECVFCNYNKNRVIYEGKNTFVILSNPRLMPGHLLIIPKRHVEKLSQLNKEELNELINLTIKFQEKILNNVAKGCDIRQNFRPFQKQDNLKVNHLHIHLLPRELFDELYEKCQIFEKDVFNKLNDEEINKFSEMLK